jgi:hypothetical protein
MKPDTSPGVRLDPDMAYDEANGVFVLFGGFASPPEYLNQTWIYNLSLNTWVEQRPTISPSGRTEPALIYDRTAEAVILFGGYDNESYYHNDTWAYNSHNNSWTDKQPLNAPSSRASRSMTYDSLNGFTVLHGGSGAGFLGDTWIYEVRNNTWTKRYDRSTPSPRSGAAMASDSANGRTILFGGFDWEFENDTWVFNALNNTWTEMRPSNPPSGRENAVLTFDQSNGLAILFGGFNWDGRNLDDTWIYNVSGNAWLEMNPSSAPSPRYSASLTFDTTNNVAVLFGGTTYFSFYKDTWTYNVTNNTWTDMAPAQSPLARSDASMGFDSQNGNVLLFGGRFWWSSPIYIYNDTWSYNVLNNTWTAIKPALSPSVRCSAPMVYDQFWGIFIMFGGDGGHSNPLCETWTFNAGDNCWTQLNLSANPPARFYTTMAYDDGTGATVLFGGRPEDNRRNEMGDTWIFTIKEGHVLDGTYTSSAIDTGGRAYFGNISWDSETSVNCTIRLQLRTGSTSQELNLSAFIGPDGDGGSFYERAGQRIFGGHNGSRWVQYRACLGTIRPSEAPNLKMVTIDCNLLQELSIISPVNDDNWTATNNVTWSASDPDNDPLSFDIHLENATNSILLVSDLPNGTTAWSWNTSAIPNGTYRIRITANDNNPSIPLTVNGTSGNFTIFHPPPPPPPPNHPPTVALLSPLNNSILNATSVRLSWNATDPEGDPLTFTVRYSNHPLGPGMVNETRTTATYLYLAGLADNTTYFWTVDAGDGTNDHTDLPAGIWTFTIRLPPVIPPPLNRPPRITSFPPAMVRAGETYAYNVTAVDDDFDVLGYLLVQAPNNMSVDKITGRLRWPTTASEVGNHTVTVRVTDTAGATDNQTFTVRVLEAPVPPPRKPACAITSPANNYRVYGRVLIAGTALNGTLPLTIVQVRVDNGDWQTAVGLGNWSLSVDLSKSARGRHTIEARSFDGSLYSDPATVMLDIRNPGPAVTVEPPVRYLLLLILIAAIATGVFLITRKNSRH